MSDDLRKTQPWPEVEGGTPREPDRFDAKAEEIIAAWNAVQRESRLVTAIAAALRAEHASALERAAQEYMQTVRRSMFPAEVGAWLRALIPPAAAPAAETGTCANFWHPGHGNEPHARRAAVGDLAAPHEDYLHDFGCLNWKRTEEPR